LEVEVTLFGVELEELMGEEGKVAQCKVMEEEGWRWMQASSLLTLRNLLLTVKVEQKQI
jgi:hypothetical protein